MKPAIISIKGIDLIKHFEGFKSKPYLCPAGIITIGIGTTRYPYGRRISLDDPEITLGEAISFLRIELAEIEKEVDSFTRDDITQNQFDALVSFAYNCGYNALRKSTLIRKVNKNPNDLIIRREFMKWIYANGKPLKGLTRRRKAEADLYFEDII